MKTFWLIVAFSAVAFAARAQYSIPWSTVDGGGGTSSGGGFTVSGTIGQPDAGQMQGGNFTLQGGFWAAFGAIQTPDAPTLKVFATNQTVVVSWPAPDVGWRLQWTADLSQNPVPWAEIAPPYTVSDTNLVYTETQPTGNRFFRLHKP